MLLSTKIAIRVGLFGLALMWKKHAVSTKNCIVAWFQLRFLEAHHLWVFFL
jgi:hypothetical protein